MDSKPENIITKKLKIVKTIQSNSFNFKKLMKFEVFELIQLNVLPILLEINIKLTHSKRF